MQSPALEGLAVLAALLSAAPAAAQTYRCTGSLNGLPSQSDVQFERAPNTVYVAGVITSPTATCTFNGEMFGGNEGDISLVERRTNERVDRVRIALTPTGYATRPERSEPYTFTCR